MYRRSSLGLMVLTGLASCVPPQAGVRTVAEIAPPAPKRARVSIAPGVILPQMPGLPDMPLPPPSIPADLSPDAAPAFVGAAQSSEDAGRAIDCLTAAVYYEARSETLDGQRAVAQVVLNRVRNPAFPGSVCGVVYQGSYRSTGCQFSFTCDGSLLRPREPGAWARARQVAETALAGDVYAPVGPAMYYHTTAVHPFWETALTPVTTIGAHIFYRWGGDLDNSFEFRQRYAGIEPAGAGQSGWDDAKQVLVRYGTTESVGVMVHRGGIGTAAVVPGTIDASQPAALATIAGVTIHTGGGVPDSDALDGDGVPDVRIHLGGPAKPADAATAAVRTAQAAPAPAVTSAPASSAARD